MLEVTVGPDDLDGGGVLVLPVLPGRLPAQHHDQGGVVILQGTHLHRKWNYAIIICHVTGYM